MSSEGERGLTLSVGSMICRCDARPGGGLRAVQHGGVRGASGDARAATRRRLVQKERGLTRRRLAVHPTQRPARQEQAQHPAELREEEQEEDEAKPRQGAPP